MPRQPCHSDPRATGQHEGAQIVSSLQEFTQALKKKPSESVRRRVSSRSNHRRFFVNAVTAALAILLFVRDQRSNSRLPAVQPKREILGDPGEPARIASNKLEDAEAECAITRD